MEVTPREDDQATDLTTDPAIVEAVEEADAEASAEVMSLLHEGVPLALLADLASPDGPASPSILEDEGLPEMAWWDHEEAPHDAGTAPATAPATDADA
ncbi:MAG: hypothetical protein HGA44_02430 [Cellulomonadaceae bacterium]|nr:hypothetical protein [Cellulomonadaceae bacterium]